MMHLYTEGVRHSVAEGSEPCGDLSLALRSIWGAVISLTNQVDRPIAAT